MSDKKNSLGTAPAIQAHNDLPTPHYHFIFFVGKNSSINSR